MAVERLDTVVHLFLCKSLLVGKFMQEELHIKFKPFKFNCEESLELIRKGKRFYDHNSDKLLSMFFVFLGNLVRES